MRLLDSPWWCDASVWEAQSPACQTSRPFSKDLAVELKSRLCLYARFVQTQMRAYGFSGLSVRVLSTSANPGRTWCGVNPVVVLPRITPQVQQVVSLPGATDTPRRISRMVFGPRGPTYLYTTCWWGRPSHVAPDLIVSLPFSALQRQQCVTRPVLETD